MGMINDKEKITVIDLPQMISTSHENAQYYFDRDVECVRTWFKKRYDFDSDDRPYLSDIICESKVDVEMKASGYTRDIKDDFENLTLNKPKDDMWDGDNEEEDEEAVEEEEVECSSGTKTEPEGGKENGGSEELTDEEDEEEADDRDEEINNKSYLPHRDKEDHKKTAHQFTVYQKSNLSKDDIKKKVRANEAKKRLKQNRIKKGEKYYINREKRAVANEIKGADSWF